MKNSYFAVYDKKANLFTAPFPSHTPGSAERSLKESINNPESVHHKYPDDFALYLVFDFDDESGLVVETYEPPRLIVEASSLVSS